jgi:glycylpeptide N-tetradecanoyltransferase
MSDQDKGKAPQRDAPDAGAEDSAKGTSFSLRSHSATLSDSSTETNDIGSSSQKKIPPKLVEALLDMNPALKNELASMDPDTAADTLAKLDIGQIMTGTAPGGKNKKDMASYKFWQTQPVPRFEDHQAKKAVTQGPIKIIKPEEVPQKPDQLLDGFEWCTLDLTNEEELRELYELLNNHYVEDDNAMFRFSYSQSFLHWYDSSTVCVV